MVDRREMNRALDAVREADRRLSEFMAARACADGWWTDPRWQQLHADEVESRGALSFTLRKLSAELRTGSTDAVIASFVYLERDPYYLGSGYAKRRVAGRLARVRLPDPYRQRARDYVLNVVDGRSHCHQPGPGRLAGAVSNNTLRRALRSRVHAHGRPVAERALQTLVHVRSPGMTPTDIAVARGVVLEAAMSDGHHLSPRIRVLIRWLWAADWRTELQAMARGRGPLPAAAAAIIRAMPHRAV